MGFGSLFSSIADMTKFTHEDTIGRGLDMWQTNYMDRKIQNRTADLNRALWAYQMGNSYQLTVNDMRKAGLNPMLLMSNGATSVGGHASSASGYTGKANHSPWMPSQSLVAAKQLGVLDSQEKKNDAEAQLASANARSVTENLRITKAINDIILADDKIKKLHSLKGVLPQNAYQAIESLLLMASPSGMQGPNPNVNRRGTD